MIETSLIRAVVLDFDGVLTDNRVTVFSDGSEAVVCNRSDGWGIRMLKEAGYIVIILSSETNAVVEARAKKLQVEAITGKIDKLTALVDWLKDNNLSQADILYVGNDLNDLECINHSGIGVAVADSHKYVIDCADHVLQKNGGDGVVQEIVDLLGIDASVVAKMDRGLN
ncbi:HAD hydrolase family protein [Rhodospirillales bacterium]|nr:HAD hydrolase family protein [Rhodospirillales bacterium]